jgi:hypothetical protein
VALLGKKGTMPKCYVTVDENTESLEMAWRESVYVGVKENHFFTDHIRSWRGFWIVVTDDHNLEDAITMASLDGDRKGQFVHPLTNKTVHWRIDGSPSVAPGSFLCRS